MPSFFVHLLLVLRRGWLAGWRADGQAFLPSLPTSVDALKLFRRYEDIEYVENRDANAKHIAI